MGPFTYGIQKNWAIHILFVEKKGANQIPGSAEKGGYSARTSYYAIYKKLPTPHPPPHPHELLRSGAGR